jgi:hypothetical protein
MYCGETIVKRSVGKHLDMCPQRKLRLEASAASERPQETLWLLRVEDAYDRDFWLYLEMRGSAPLMKLDDYLRAIWLECCGHLSEFTIGGWQGIKVGKARKADGVFEPGLKLRHLYDFGTTSETDIHVLGVRPGKAPTKHPIELMARNNPPKYVCQECDQPAVSLCMECIYEEDRPGLLCAAHTEDHPHEQYDGPIALVNSPRLGMCGYEGPAEPPY